MNAQNQAEIKIQNRNRIIRLLLTGPPVSRIALAQKTGLTKMTVSNIVSGLLDEAMVEETEPTGSGPGRNPIPLTISTRAKKLAGLYLSRNEATALLCDLKGNVLSSRECPLKNESNSSLTKKIYTLLDALFTQLSPSEIYAIGVSSIGPFDPERGTLLTPPRFGSVSKLPVAQLLASRYGLPVFADNDMNAAAQAEKFFGRAAACRSFIYLGVSDGIGAGIFIGGRLYRGSTGSSGEIGHITVDMGGRQCACGNRGCLELYASVPAAFPALPDAQQKETVDQLVPYLSAGVISLINLFDPECIILGHELALQGEYAARKITEAVTGKYLSSEARPVKIIASAFGSNAPEVGAAALCIGHLFPI